jgi:lipopolysaccharide transport protein LptA
MLKNAEIVILMIALGSFASAAMPPAPEDQEATISSDQMEILQNGQRTVFIGHVVLEKTTSKLTANRMTRFSDGHVEADGRIVTTWVNPDQSGSVEARGAYARYDPASESAQLWNKPNKKISVKWQDKQGSGFFEGDRGVLEFSPKRARLVGQVTGHIIPATR